MANSIDTTNLANLVSNLPEIYQPIYKYAEFSKNVSRDCLDRLEHISAVFKALQKNLNRPVRVLDLGCAQGFFSLNLASLGAEVEGIDYCDKNVAVCQALAKENPELNVTFKVGQIEEFVESSDFGQYDIILGLSVFHHLIHEHGVKRVQELLSVLASKSLICIFEVALKTEPLYWAEVQLEDPEQLLEGFSFVYEIAQAGTHLSEQKRPIFVASNKYWYLNGTFGTFGHWQIKSHFLAGDAHGGTRKYYFGNGLIIKVFSLAVEEMVEPNLKEYQNEVIFFEQDIPSFAIPRIILAGKNEKEAWIVREQFHGKLLSEIIQSKEQYDKGKVLFGILKQLQLLEKHGLYHNDLRTWNVLIDDQGHPQLIDFGSISSSPDDCVWPYNIFISFILFVKEVFAGKTEHPNLVRIPTIHFDHISEPYKSAIIKLIKLPVNEWKFSFLYSAITSIHASDAVESNAITPKGYIYLLNLIDEGAETLKNLAQEVENKAQEIEGKAQEVESKVQEVESKAQEVESKVQEVESKVQEAESKVQEIKIQANAYLAEIQAIRSSISWKITAPLRKTTEAARWFIRNVLAWILLKLSRVKSAIIRIKKYSPRYIFRVLLRRSISFINRRSFLSIRLKKYLFRFPRLRRYLFSVVHSSSAKSHKQNIHAITREKQVNIPKYVNMRNKSANDVFSTVSVPSLRLRGRRTIFYYVDHTIMCENHTGVQNVVKRLNKALHENSENMVFIKWDYSIKKFVVLDPPNGVDKFSIPEDIESGIILTKKNIDKGDWIIVPEVTHISFHPSDVTMDVIAESKRLGLLSGFIFYDAIPLHRPEMTEIAFRHQKYMSELFLADLIMPISEYSGKELSAFFRIHERADLASMPDIINLPLPGESALSKRKIHKKIKLNEKIILSVGTIEPRKNQLALLEAFLRFKTNKKKSNSWRLVLVGNLHPLVAEKVLGIVNKNPDIEYLGHCSDDMLEELYEACTFTVYPSIEEGFGLPIMESLWNGKPCICANFGAMAEISDEGGCLSVDTNDIEALEVAITQLANDDELLELLIDQAISRPIKTWQEYGADVSLILDQKSNPMNGFGKIYYWVDHTTTYPSNSGIQRVARALARSMIEIGLELIPVKWDIATCKFYQPSVDELKHLAKWNGPAVDSWADWAEPDEASAADWLLVPELISYLPGHVMGDIDTYVNKIGLRTAIIFHDAIPFTWAEFYPPEAASAHAAYMDGLTNYNLILPNSHYSKYELAAYLISCPVRTHSFDQRFKTCVLPGEFSEIDRNTESKKTNNDIIRILCVATIEARKNHIVLLEAFKKLSDKLPNKVELILVGSNPFPDLTEKVQSYINSVPGIRWEKSADDAQLHKLYQECDFTVFPSLAEGFGLPILESLWNARPCICASFGAMAEVAEGGGCLTVDVTDARTLSDAMYALASDSDLYQQLSQQAQARDFKTWNDYAIEVAIQMANERHILVKRDKKPITLENQSLNMLNLKQRPLLSICISTYNRADWLATCLQNLTSLIPEPILDVEIFVCDNESSDHTQDVVKPYFDRSDFHYQRNPKNVGMLGNLQVTAHDAAGQYIWILGDDDLVKSGTIENILHIIRDNPDLAMIYLNYSYTREESPRSADDINKFIKNAIPIVKPEPDIIATVREISTRSENFFTAIYCLIFRRDHAIKAYSTNTEGRPFSSLPTCIPTTHYVLNYMMDEPAYWVGNPQLVVNMNVSWMKYAPLWILERIPEALDLAERMGATPEEVDNWRSHHLTGIAHFWREMFENDEIGNSEYFSPMRLIMRLKHLPDFKLIAEELETIYDKAHQSGVSFADIPTKTLFSILSK